MQEGDNKKDGLDNKSSCARPLVSIMCLSHLVTYIDAWAQWVIGKNEVKLNQLRLRPKSKQRDNIIPEISNPFFQLGGKSPRGSTFDDREGEF